MLCVTDVYLRDVPKMIFKILHLNVSHLSVCSTCYLTHSNRDELSVKLY